MSVSGSDTQRTIWKNSVSQVGGRLLLSVARFVGAAVIVRYAGSEMFGAYSLILNFLFLWEFLTEFGQVDIGVRNICRQPEREGIVLRALMRLLAMQGVLFALLLPPLIYLLDYDASLVRAASIGSIGVLCYAALQVFRVGFKVHMTMERDVLAELAGVAIMLPLTWYVAVRGGGLEALIACYTLSRVVFLAVAAALGRGSLRLLGGPTVPGEPSQLWRQALPLGLSGLSVAVYDGLAPIILSKVADMHSVAMFAGACRYFFPVLVVVQAITTVFYPILSRYWRKSPARLRAMQQIALEAALLIGSGFACVIFAGANFLMRLIGPSLENAAGLLRLMACVLIARALTAAMSPLIVVGGYQTATLWLGLAAIALHALALFALIPLFGVSGVAIAYLLVEFFAGALPVSFVGQRASGVRLDWVPPIKIIGAAVAAAGLTELLPFAGTLWSGMVCGALYAAFTVATGTLSPRVLQATLRRTPEAFDGEGDAQPAGVGGVAAAEQALPR